MPLRSVTGSVRCAPSTHNDRRRAPGGGSSGSAPPAPVPGARPLENSFAIRRLRGQQGVKTRRWGSLRKESLGKSWDRWLAGCWHVACCVEHHSPFPSSWDGVHQERRWVQRRRFFGVLEPKPTKEHPPPILSNSTAGNTEKRTAPKAPKKLLSLLFMIPICKRTHLQVGPRNKTK